MTGRGGRYVKAKKTVKFCMSLRRRDMQLARHVTTHDNTEEQMACRPFLGARFPGNSAGFQLVCPTSLPISNRKTVQQDRCAVQ